VIRRSVERIGEIFGKPWPRQTVYLLEQGERRLAAEEVVAIAVVLDVSIDDLFTPNTDVDDVQVGRLRIPRERLVAQGRKDSARLYEVARHFQALTRSLTDNSETLSAQLRVMDDLQRAFSGKPSTEVPPEVPSGPHAGLKSFLAASRWRAYERAQTWYEPEHVAPEDPEGESQ